jgi:hypothetical protein
MAAWEYCHVDWMIFSVDRLERSHEAKLARRDLIVVRDGADQMQADVIYGDVHFFRSQEHLKVERLSDTLTQLGLAGWELVGFTRESERWADGTKTTEVYMLKRPVQE